MKTSAHQSVTVVIPVYNAVEALKRVVPLIDEALRKMGRDYEIIIAEDGSLDGTSDYAAALARDNFHILHSHARQRLGRGGALQRAMRQAAGDIVLYVDVDLNIPLRYMNVLIEKVAAGSDIAIVSKRHPAARTRSPIYRTFMSVTYNWLVREILSSKCYCHQSGMKCFSKECLKDILNLVEDTKWFWDTEILVIGQWMNKRIYEEPIECNYGFGNSTVRYWRDSCDMLGQIFRLLGRKRQIVGKPTGNE